VERDSVVQLIVDDCVIVGLDDAGVQVQERGTHCPRRSTAFGYGTAQPLDQNNNNIYQTIHEIMSVGQVFSSGLDAMNTILSSS
jgi:hypothetical protein